MNGSRSSATVTVARGAFLILAGLAVSRLLNYAYRILLAREGGTGEFGVLFLAISTIAVAGSISTLGVDYGAARFVPLLSGRGDRQGVRAALRFSLLSAFISGTLSGLVLHLVSDRLALALFQSEALVPALRLCAWCLPFYVCGRVLIKAVAAFQKIGYRVGVYQVFNPLVKLLLTAILLTFGLGAVGALWAYLVAEAASSLALWIILERKIFGILTGDTGNGGSGGFRTREFMLYSLPLFMAGMIDIVMSYTDAFMTGHFMDNSSVGIYGAAATLASVVALGTELLNPLFLSIITRDWAAGRSEAVVSAFNNNNRWFMYLTLPVLAVFLAMPDGLMRFFWGGGFGSGASALVLLCAGRFMYNAENTSLQVLSMHGATGFLLAINLLVALLNLGLNYWLIPILGIEGAALGTAISLTLHGVLVIGAARLLHQGQGMRIVFPGIMAAASVPAVVCWWIVRVLPESWGSLVTAGIVYLLLYGILLRLFRVFSEEDRMVWQSLRRRLKGQRAGNGG